jgi:hypothetical protein
MHFHILLNKHITYENILNIDRYETLVTPSCLRTIAEYASSENFA